MKIVYEFTSFLLLTYLCIQALETTSAQSIVFSLGYSGLTTAEGGKIAANSAKTGLKGAAAKLVFVILKEGEVKDCPATIKAIATVFDSSIIYGTRTVADADAILTVNGRTDKIVVVAIGGGVQFASASASPSSVGTGAAQTACGKTIGESLKGTLDQIPPGKGKFIVLYGDCHVDMDDYLTKGLISTLPDKKTPVVGNASIWVMEKGKIYEKGKNMGLLVWGDFTTHCGMAFDHEGTNDADAIVKKACTALKRAGVDTAKKAPDFCLINNCRGRFQNLSAKAGYAKKEADTIIHTLGTSVPFVSIYGSGEIGKMSDTSIAVGDGNSISVLTITANPTTPVHYLPEKSPAQGCIFNSKSFANEQIKYYSINGKLLNHSVLPAYKSAGAIIVQSSALKNEKLTHAVQK